MFLKISPQEDIWTAWKNRLSPLQFGSSSEYQYIYRSIAIGDEVPLAVCYTAHASSVYVIWYLPKWPVQQHGVNLIATKRMIGCFARIFVCGGKFWIPLEGELKAELVQDCVLSRPSGLLFSIMSSIWIITDDILRSVLEIKRQNLYSFIILFCVTRLKTLKKFIKLNAINEMEIKIFYKKILFFKWCFCSSVGERCHCRSTS